MIFASINVQRVIETSAVSRTKSARKAVARRPLPKAAAQAEFLDLEPIDTRDPTLQTFSVEMKDDPRRRR